MRHILALPMALAVLAGPAMALDLRGPVLAAASNFGQGAQPEMLDAALALPVRDFRDAVYWDRVEDAAGTFTFEGDRDSFPDALALGGARMSLTVNFGHPAYDKGNTPLSDAAVRAFGRHAAEVVARFPNIDAVEVGNEFNSANFVEGPLKDQDLDARAQAYARLLASVSGQVHAVRPDVRIIGGGVHSIPTGYLSRLTRRGAVGHMDAIALHPYSTPVEHIARQVAVMRRDPALREMPVEITEFGSQDPEAAPGVLMRGYCQMALAGVSRMAWYALNDRGDDYVPLIDAAGETTDAGRAFLFAQEELEGRAVVDASDDAFTYACLFAGRKLVIWGMPRDLRVMSDAVTVHDVRGNLLDGRGFRLSETEPLILIAPDALVEGRDFALGPQEVLADSYHQFPYPPEDGDTADCDGLHVHVATPDAEVPMVLMPGQARPGTPWTPYLGIASDASVRVQPDSLLPGGGKSFPVEIRHAFVAPEDMRVSVEAHFDPASRSKDGVTVRITLDGVEQIAFNSRERMEFSRLAIPMAAGSRLEFAVGPNGNAKGDVTEFRITLRRAE